MSARPALLLTAALLLSPAIANAETRLVSIVFDEVSGRRADDDLVIEYRITNRSWRKLERGRIRPQLHVVLENADRGPPSRVSYDRELTRQDGVLNLAVPSSIGKLRCEIWVTGGHRGAHIAWMDLGGVEVERATLRIRSSGSVDAPPPSVMEPPPVPPPAANWAAEPRVIEVCGAAFDGPTNEKACVLAVKSSARDPVSTINACEGAMDGDANELECVRIATAFAKDPVPVIGACESARAGDAQELECLRTASGR